MLAVSTTALTRVIAAREVVEFDSGAVEFADCGSRVAGAGVGVALLVVLDAAGRFLEEAFAGRRVILPALDQRVDRDMHLAHGNVRIFFPAAADRLWRETGN